MSLNKRYFQEHSSLKSAEIRAAKLDLLGSGIASIGDALQTIASAIEFQAIRTLEEEEEQQDEEDKDQQLQKMQQKIHQLESEIKKIRSTTNTY